MSAIRLALISLVLVIVGCSGEDTLELSDKYSIDYSKPSYETRIPFPEGNYSYRSFSTWHAPLEAVILDYNGDGYLDIIDTRSEYGTQTTNTILFLLGDASGKLRTDTLNSNKFRGLVHGRKGLTGDFNNDGLPDAFFLGTGLDFPPYDGEYPILLLNSPTGEFTEERLTETVGYFHGGASGDIDNDGDLDIILISGPSAQKSRVLINDGQGKFTATTLTQHPLFLAGVFTDFVWGKYTVEIYDINKDSFLDVVMAGHEFGELDSSGVVFYGSDTGYNQAPFKIPSTARYSITTDIDFFDLDDDGSEEIILHRTTNVPFYHGFNISVISTTSELDVTSSFFNDNTNQSTPGEKWIPWLSVYENADGNTIIRGSDMESTQKWVQDRQTKKFNRN